MKILRFIVVVGVGIYLWKVYEANRPVAKELSQENEVASEVVVKAEPEKAANRGTAPAVVALAVVESGAPMGSRLSAPGTFYTVRYFSAESADGILGVPPGSLVTETKGGKYRYKDQELELPAELLTNEVELGHRAAMSDRQAQGALSNAAAVRVPAASPPAPVAAVEPAHVPEAQSPASAAPLGGNSGLNSKAYNQVDFKDGIRRK